MVRFRESLTPSLPFHLALLVLMPMGFGMVAPLSVPGGIIVGVVIYAASLVMFVGLAPRVEVTDTTFRAGRARIDRSFVGRATVVPRANRVDAIANARTWKVLRAWIPDGVVVTITDPEDPTPSWYVSSRRPDELARVLNDD